MLQFEFNESKKQKSKQTRTNQTTTLPAHKHTDMITQNSDYTSAQSPQSYSVLTHFHTPHWLKCGSCKPAALARFDLTRQYPQTSKHIPQTQMLSICVRTVSGKISTGITQVTGPGPTAYATTMPITVRRPITRYCECLVNPPNADSAKIIYIIDMAVYAHSSNGRRPIRSKSQMERSKVTPKLIPPTIACNTARCS